MGTRHTNTALSSLAVGIKANIIWSCSSNHASQRSQWSWQDYTERLDLLQLFLSPALVVQGVVCKPKLNIGSPKISVQCAKCFASYPCPVMAEISVSPVCQKVQSSTETERRELHFNADLPLLHVTKSCVLKYHLCVLEIEGSFAHLRIIDCA